MELGHWVPFNPLKKINIAYYIHSYISTLEELKFTFFEYSEKKNSEVHVTFFSGEEICKKAKALYRSELWQYLNGTHKMLDKTWPLYIVENSAYLKLISKESMAVTDLLKFKHYCIMDDTWTFDVASQQQPRIELFTGGKLAEMAEFRWH
jgi:hypothetical protein